MKAMILAAGLGTRLRPLTDDRPKALVEVAGRTLLEITLERLRAFEFREVIINVHHFADKVVDYLKENGERTTPEIEAYSLRRTLAGHVVLYAYDTQKPDHIRNYRTDRIRGARATARTFAPRYAIELTPGGMQSIPAARTGRRQ